MLLRVDSCKSQIRYNLSNKPNMKKYQVVLWILITMVGASAQTRSIAHFNKFTPEQNNFWMNHMQEELDSINSSKVCWLDKSRYHYYNRFIGLLPHKPKNPNILLERFKEGFFFEPNEFCNQVNKDLNQRVAYNSYSKLHFRAELSIIKQYCSCQDSSYNQLLIEELKVISKDDQELRLSSDFLANKAELQRKRDSLNQSKIVEMILTYGYPGRNMVGIEYEDVVFLVIQHSNLEMMEKYLPLIKYNIGIKNLSPIYFAYLHDRIEMLNNRPQTYGTQHIIDNASEDSILYKLEDPIKVNALRRSVGLNYLAGYPTTKN